MSDETDEPANDRGDEDRLPWLEAVEDDDGANEGPSVAKLIAAIFIGLVAIGLIVGGLFWLGNRGQPGANGEVIAAPEGDYKVRPDNPGGMNASGDGEIAAAASEGQQPQGALNTQAVAEAPVNQPPAAGTQNNAPAQGAHPATGANAPAANGHPATGATAPATAGHPAPGQPAAPAHPAPAPAHPAPAPAASHPAAPAPSGPGIQLGAFNSQAVANNAWTALSGRFHYLAPLTHNVVVAQVGGRTYYRLRASGPGAADVCHRLQAAGEACAPVN